MSDIFISFCILYFFTKGTARRSLIFLGIVSFLHFGPLQSANGQVAAFLTRQKAGFKFF